MLPPAILYFAAISASAECASIADAHRYIGKTQCISGTVLRVKEGDQGVTYLDFCEDSRTCPFTVVVFRNDLKHVGDLRHLTGHAIEINGTIQDYDGRAEIILRHPRQLGKDAALVPPLPRDYDVERRGNYSPGKFSHPKPKKKTHHRRGRGVDIEDPSDQ